MRVGPTSPFGALAQFTTSITNKLTDIAIDAAAKGQTRKMRIAVALGADITARNNQAVIVTAIFGHAETMRAVVRLGGDVTARNSDAVEWAAAKGHTETLITAVALGADPKGGLNKSPHMVASTNGHLETAGMAALLAEAEDSQASAKNILAGLGAAKVQPEAAPRARVGAASRPS